MAIIGSLWFFNNAKDLDCVGALSFLNNLFTTFRLFVAKYKSNWSGNFRNGVQQGKQKNK